MTHNFFSWECSVTGKSIPAYPWGKSPKEASDVVLVLPDNTTFRGIYDGEGRLRKYNKNLECIATLNILKTLERFQEVREPRLVRADTFDGQLYTDLEPSFPCRHNGFFYDEAPSVHNAIRTGFCKKQVLTIFLNKKRKRTDSDDDDDSESDSGSRSKRHWKTQKEYIKAVDRALQNLSERKRVRFSLAGECQQVNKIYI